MSAPCSMIPLFQNSKTSTCFHLIYDEKNERCNILVFDYNRAIADTTRIVREEAGRGRKHPVYKFYNASNEYICEVRYGNAAANALQRGLWTHTKNAIGYFDSITNGWITYAHNHVLVQLFSHSLVSSEEGHRVALQNVIADIERLKSIPELQS